MITTDIYCRTATDDADTQAKLARQEADCRAYCDEHGLSVGMVHHEVASAATYRERPYLRLLRTRYYRAEIQGVVVSHLHRLSHSQTHLFILMEEMIKHGVILYSAREQIDETVMGRFVQIVMSFTAEVERERGLDTLEFDLNH